MHLEKVLFHQFLVRNNNDLEMLYNKLREINNIEFMFFQYDTIKAMKRNYIVLVCFFLIFSFKLFSQIINEGDLKIETLTSVYFSNDYTNNGTHHSNVDLYLQQKKRRRSVKNIDFQFTTCAVSVFVKVEKSLSSSFNFGVINVSQNGFCGFL